MRRTTSVMVAAVVFGGIALAQEVPETTPRFGIEADTATTRVYTSKFDANHAEGWSVRSLRQAPKGQRFLGDFNNDLVSLRVTRLPEHALLKVTFDLYIINTWDGSGVISAGGGPTGPDMVSVDVDGSRNILRATFSNIPDTGNFAEDGKRQTYPSPIPSRSVAAGTGALGIHELGYIFTYNPPGVSFPQDSSYTITRTFPHDADEVILDFAGMNLQSRDDESWGVANVVIEALPDEAAPVLDEAEQKTAFGRIVSGSVPATARDAFWQLVADGNSTVTFLERTADGFGVDQDRVATLIRDLDQPGTREAAVLALAELGPVIEPLLRDAVRENPKRGVDVDRALMMIEITPLEGPHARASAAAARLLATIATPEAQRVYAALAAKPSPVQPGTPAYEAEWKERFNHVYRLRPHEHLRFVPKPFIPERDLFLKSTGTVPLPDPATSFTARTGSTPDAPDATISYRTPAPQQKTGVATAAAMIGLYGLSVPDSLNDIAFDGDFVIRPRVKQKLAAPAFVEFMRRHANRNVRIDEATIIEKRLVVTGPQRADPAAGEPPILELTAAPLVEVAPPDRMRVHTMALASVVHLLGQTAKAPWTIDDHLRDRRFRIRSDQLTALTGVTDRDTVQKIIDNIAAQTDLKFQWEPQSRQQLTLVDLGEVKAE